MSACIYRRTKGGSYWTGKGRGARDLGTADRAEALRLAGAPSSPPPPPAFAPLPSSPPAPPPPRPGEDKMRALFAAEAAQVPAGSAAPPQPTTSNHPEPTQHEGGAAPAGSTPGRVALSADEGKKLAELAAVMATQLNQIAVGAAVRVFGRRKPSTDNIDEQWEELNSKAWASILEKFIGPREASPLGIVLVSSVGMGLQMFAAGEALPAAPATPDPLRAYEAPEAAQEAGDDVDPTAEYKRRWREQDETADA